MLGPVTGDAPARFLQCVFVRVYMLMCVHQHIRKPLYIFVYMCLLCTRAYGCVCICLCMPVCTPMLCVCVCACLCMCINMYVTLCVHVGTSGVAQCKYYLSFQLKIIVE